MGEAYDTFAPHFDDWQRAFGGVYDALILPRVLAALDRHGHRDGHVADLGAGTGDLVVALARRGHRVTAVDRSEPMLAEARAKVAAAGLPSSPAFVRQDLRALRLADPLDAAVCVYTVMNQLVDDGDLVRVLAAVHDALRPGGLFLFELNLPASYARYWSGTETIDLPTAVIVREHRAIGGGPVVEARVTIRRRDGGETHDRILQRPYDDAEVEAAVAQAGLVEIERELYDPFAAGDVPTKALWIVRRP